MSEGPFSHIEDQLFVNGRGNGSSYEYKVGYCHPIYGCGYIASIIEFSDALGLFGSHVLCENRIQL